MTACREKGNFHFSKLKQFALQCTLQETSSRQARPEWPIFQLATVGPLGWHVGAGSEAGPADQGPADSCCSRCDGRGRQGHGFRWAAPGLYIRCAPPSEPTQADGPSSGGRDRTNPLPQTLSPECSVKSLACLDSCTVHRPRGRCCGPQSPLPTESYLACHVQLHPPRPGSVSRGRAGGLRCSSLHGPPGCLPPPVLQTFGHTHDGIPQT